MPGLSMWPRRRRRRRRLWLVVLCRPLFAHYVDCGERSLSRRSSLLLTLPTALLLDGGSAAAASTLEESVMNTKPSDVRRLSPDGPVKQWCAPPDWLQGEWNVERSRVDGVWFSSGLRPKSSATLGARMGTILPLPNVGATPRNYRQIYSGKSVDAGFNDVETLEAFWPSARDVTAEVVSPTRKVLTYLAPTVSRGTRRQRADVLVDARSCAKPNSKTWLLAEHVAQSTGIVDDNSTTFSDGVLAVAAGEYTSIALFENLPRADGGEPRRVRKRLRVAVFEAPVLEKALYPAAVYDYSFLLRR